ncbi:AAA family ATPase [Dactylosporangium sucinum]|uniref:OmpR/PhoB-type domain-containing protein n=1 Tax=Dactylosporangium sucinum TaxID=1424081 RepID=A0A917T1S6_9ACTN|nr:AAA family ATPase [Dactylosporangium sucinum]GGM06003.1 hypothetical protein GCM10007977_003970 [Dactylosporangium sucinum]
MKVAVLGPVEVVDGEEPVDAGAPKQRAVLAALALHRPRAVAVDALVDLLWGDSPPPSPLSSLHGYIAGLRRVVEPGRAARGRPSVLVTVPPGYALRLADDDVDADRFAATVDAAHRRLAVAESSTSGALPAVPAGISRAELDAVATRLSGALALWRGTPYLELDEAEAAVAERARLAELRLVAIEDLALARLALGEPATVAAALEAEARRHPLRERLWALLALALGRAGRQAEAIESLQEIRRALTEELGVDPGATLRAVELAVLRQELPTTHPPAPEPSDRAGSIDPSSADPRDWPLAGRDAELAALTGLLAEARRGHTRFALLTGEPGIGKSRLTAELARQAAGAGFAVLTGRCSEDEGAPPFWPWTGVLRDLAAALGSGTVRELAGPDADVLPGVTGPATKPVSVDAERFRVFDAVARLLTAAAGRTPLLVVLDDLHWADPSSLRLVRHLTDHLPETRLVLAATRRRHPEPAGALAEAGVGLVRRHALRLDLTGLSADGVGALVRAAGDEAAADRVAALRERTDGNPFFLVELLRFGNAPAGQIPAAVTDVLARRVARLPAPTGELLRCAAVVGREYDLEVLAAVAGADPDTVLDDVDPAVAAGIVLEDAASGRFRFAHALVRDVVYRAQPATRRARRHATVARVLDGTGRLSEAARHWLAAGPAHAGVAWRAAARAAGQARALRGHEEAVRLLAAARVAQAQDGACTPGDRYDLLMAHADACEWVGDRDGQLEAIDLACAAAVELGDVERLARAAVRTPDGSMWPVRDLDVVHPPAVVALRRVLRELPAADGELRCRALLTLAGELHYADAPLERDALADEGLAMARRLGDPDLLVWAAGTAFTAVWLAGNAERRWRDIEEAIRLAELDAPVPGQSAARQADRTRLITYRAVAAQETGRIEAMWADLAVARAEAERLRLAFPLLVVGTMDGPWLAMRGRFAEAETRVAELTATAERTLLPTREFFASAAAFIRIWQGRAEELLPVVRTVHEAHPTTSGAMFLLLLLHAGRLDEAAEVNERRVEHPASWALPFDLSVAAYAAFALARPAQAADVYRRLAPLAGRTASAGSGAPIGPVDAYLALAASAAGEPELARRHAADAEALIEAWDIPVFGAWFARVSGRTAGARPTGRPRAAGG